MVNTVKCEYTTIYRDDRRQIPSKRRHISGLLKSGWDLAEYCLRANYESSGPQTLESLQLRYASFSDDRTYKKVASKFKVKGWHTTGNSLILATSYVYTQVTAKIISIGSTVSDKNTFPLTTGVIWCIAYKVVHGSGLIASTDTSPIISELLHVESNVTGIYFAVSNNKNPISMWPASKPNSITKNEPEWGFQWERIVVPFTWKASIGPPHVVGHPKLLFPFPLKIPCKGNQQAS